MGKIRVVALVDLEFGWTWDFAYRGGACNAEATSLSTDALRDRLRLHRGDTSIVYKRDNCLVSYK